MVAKRDARREDRLVAAARTSRAWERYAWVAGIVFVIALVAESVVATGVGLTQNDSATKIANALHDHREQQLVIAYLSVVYATAFLIYLCSLYNLLRGDTGQPRILALLVVVGGVLFAALHAVSDIGITGLLGAKLASFGSQHDPGIAYALYLITYALDSVGDVFGSLAAFATGLLVIKSGVLPRWLGLGFDSDRDPVLPSRLRPRRRHRLVRFGSRPHRLRTLPDLRAREQRHPAQAP
jgi:hypothetical protein